MIECDAVAKKSTTKIDVEGILKDFAELPCPRSRVNQHHLIIAISIMAVIVGAEGPKTIGARAKSNEAWLKARLELPSGFPSHDTIGRFLMALVDGAHAVRISNVFRGLDRASFWQAGGR